jgi:LPXTG-site transpeptidase (sortase) family protein
MHNRFKLLMLGLSLIGLGLVLLWQPLSYAFDNTSYTVRSELSDQMLFGKSISDYKPELRVFSSNLQPANSPIEPSRIRIPRLAIDTIVEEVGITANGTMDVPGNIWHTAWLKSGKKPGEVGNAVIAGHLDAVKSTAIFWDLGKLSKGDRVFVSDKNGFELTFEVIKVTTYDLKTAPLAEIFGITDEKNLNLVTCEGIFSKDERTYNKRLVVYTRLVT